MRRKKNKFWTLIFSLLPGAGEMYLGFMKQGISLMTLFFAVIAICAFFNFEAGLFILPVIWFYSFFHVHNLNGSSDEEFAQVEDEYLVHLPDEMTNWTLTGKKQAILAWGLIIVGVYSLWKIFLDVIYEIIPPELYSFMYTLSYLLPQLLLSILLIVLGVHLILGKKVQLDRENEDPFAGNVFGEDTREDYFQDDTDHAVHNPVKTTFENNFEANDLDSTDDTPQ